MSFIITSAFVALQTLILNNREPLFYAKQKYTISFVHFHLERGRSGVSTPHVGGPSIYNNEITFFFCFGSKHFTFGDNSTNFCSLNQLIFLLLTDSERNSQLSKIV